MLPATVLSKFSTKHNNRDANRTLLVSAENTSRLACGGSRSRPPPSPAPPKPFAAWSISIPSRREDKPDEAEKWRAKLEGV